MNKELYGFTVLFLYLIVSFTGAPTSQGSPISDHLDVIDDDDDVDIFDNILNANKDLGIAKTFEGDLVKHDERSMLRAALSNQSRLWPGGIVYYDVSLFMLYPDSLRKAMDDIEAATCIRFKQYTGSEPYHLYIVSKSGCWSDLGRVEKVQELSLGDGCSKVGTAQHELMHALGFHHEQSRPDRDNYVTINMNNVLFVYKKNFEKGNSNEFQKFTPYDYQSVMHYSSNAFSRNGKPTIVPKPNPNTPIGQRVGMTSRDKQDINMLYNCHAVGAMDGAWGSWTPFGDCIPNCSFGRKTRTRSCNNPKPRNGGRECSGEDSQSLLCSKEDCTNEESGNCNFENNMCAWKSFAKFSGQNTLRFERGSGSTPSISTGPSFDHTLGNATGTYIYVEVTGAAKNDYGLLNGPMLPMLPGSTNRCLSFWYNMYGEDMGYMMVYLQDVSHGYQELLWHAGGNKGNLWKFKNITIDATSEKKINFYGMRGISFTGDMALDDINVEEGKCMSLTR